MSLSWTNLKALYNLSICITHPTLSFDRLAKPKPYQKDEVIYSDS
jgi:hypothetical protein